MANESIGGVSVAITGDTSQLTTAFATAQGSAQVAGSQVAAAFNTSAGAATNFTAEVDRLITAIAEQNVALSLSIQRNLANAAALRTGSQAAHGSVTEIQAVSGTLRTLEGNGGIRAAERFLTMIPGLATGLQFAFPVIGAIALGKVFGEMAVKAIGLKEAEEALKKATEDSDNAFERDLNTIEKVNVALQTMQFGAAAGKRLEGFYTQQAADRDLDKVKDLGGQVQEMVRQASSFHLFDVVPILGAQARKKESDDIATKQQEQAKFLADSEGKGYQVVEQKAQAAKSAAEQAGQLQAARISNQEKANAALADMQKRVADQQITASHSTVETEIAAMHNREAADMASAAEEVRVAKAKEEEITSRLAAELPKRLALIRQQGAAEAMGKDQPEQQRIGVQTQGKLSDAQTEAAKQIMDAGDAVVAAQDKSTTAIATYNRKAAVDSEEAWQKFFDGISKKAQLAQKQLDDLIKKQLIASARVSEIQDKAGGRVQAGNIDQQKLALERAYSLQVGTTARQELAYRQQIAALEDSANTAKLTGLAKELQDAQSIADKDDQSVAVARIQAQLEEEGVKAANDAYAAKTKTLDLEQRITLQYQLRAALAGAGASIPGALGGAISSGIFSGGKKGEDVGTQIEKALKNVGQQLLGTVITAAIKQLATTILANTAAQTIMHSIFGVAAGSQTANTTALTASTAANTALTTATVAAAAAQVPAMAALTAALTANTVAVGISDALLGFAGGTDSAPGGWSMVGERGPEAMYVPRGASIVPNHKLGGYADGVNYSRFSSGSYSSSGGSIGELHIHAHGITNPDAFTRHIARTLPQYLKSTSPNYSPGSN